MLVATEGSEKTSGQCCCMVQLAYRQTEIENVECVDLTPFSLLSFALCEKKSFERNPRNERSEREGFRSSVVLAIHLAIAIGSKLFRIGSKYLYSLDSYFHVHRLESRLNSFHYRHRYALFSLGNQR